MPTPREAYVNTVEQQGFSGARVRPAEFGAGQIIARSAAQFGQQVTQVADDVDEIQTIYATAAAKDADAQAALKLSALTTGFKQLEQGDAVSAKGKALEDIDALERETLGSLKDSRARSMFKDVFGRRKLGALTAIQEHEATQVKAYSDAKSKARQSASMIVAIDAPTEEEMFLNIETGINERWSRMSGAADEDKAFEAFKLRSDVLARRAQTIRDPIAQNQFVAKYSKWIAPDAEVSLIRANAPGLADAQAAFRSNDFAAWRSGGKKPELVRTPGSPVTLIDEDTGEEVPAGSMVPVELPPSEPGRAAAPVEEPASNLATPKPRVVAVVKGANYDPTRGIGSVSETVEGHRARNGGRGRTAIDIAAPIGTPLYPPVRGKVIEAPREKRGDNGYMVRVDYGNGTVGTYIHLKGPSPLNEGDVVETSNVIGLVGNTGRSTGPHVDYSVTRNGAVVNPNKAVYRGYDGEGGTPDSVLDQYKPEDADTTTLVADIREYARQAGLSPVEERQLLRDQMEVVNFNRGLQQDKERQADRRADEWFIGIGDRPFKISEVPGWSELSPASKQTFITAQEIRSRPKEPEAGGQSYIDAMVTAERDPAAFQALNLDTMPLTKEERTRLKIKQGTLTGADGKPNATAIDDEDYINQRMNTYLRSEGVIEGNADKKTEIDAREALRQRVLQRIAQRERENGGKKLGRQEVDAIVQEAVTRVTYTTPGGQKVTRRLYEIKKAEPGATLGINPRDRARNALRRANRGIPPTEQQIDEFLREQGS